MTYVYLLIPYISQSHSFTIMWFYKQPSQLPNIKITYMETQIEAITEQEIHRRSLLPLFEKMVWVHKEKTEIITSNLATWKDATLWKQKNGC